MPAKGIKVAEVYLHEGIVLWSFKGLGRRRC